MAAQPDGMMCVLEVLIDVPGWHITMIKLFKRIQDVSYSINTQTRLAYVYGRIDKELLLKLLAKIQPHVSLREIHYGIQLPKRNSEPLMQCSLMVDTDMAGWQLTMCRLFRPMQDVTFRINAYKQAYISGRVSPALQLKLLAKAEAQAVSLINLSYGAEVDPYGRPIPQQPPPPAEANEATANPASASAPPPAKAPAPTLATSKSKFSFGSFKKFFTEPI